MFSSASRIATITVSVWLLVACGSNNSKDPVSSVATPTDAASSMGKTTAPSDAQAATNASTKTRRPPTVTPPAQPPIATPPTQPPAKGPGKMRDDMASIVEQVEKLTGGKKVRALGPNNIPGIAVLQIESGTSKRGGTGYRSSLLVDGSKTLLHDKKAMRAALKHSKDPETLATLCMYFLEGHTNSSAIVDPSSVKTSADVRALIRPPTLTKDWLEYWTFYGSPQRTVNKKRLRLSSLELESVSGSKFVNQALGPLAVAKKQLQTSNQSLIRRAVTTLGDGCGEIDGAAALLLETMKSHPSVFARVEAGKRVRKCHGVNAATTLIKILAGDTDDGVRMWAAATLGDIGDPGARPALESASTSSDRHLKGAAKRALKKLR